MKKTILTLALLSLSPMVFAMNMTIKVSNTGNNKGNLEIAIFNSQESYEKKKPFKEVSVPVTKDETSGTATVDLPAGDYMIVTFLDENGNKKLDTKLGIPSERFGASNNPQNLGAPKFDACVVRLDEKENTLSIKLRKLL